MKNPHPSKEMGKPQFELEYIFTIHYYYYYYYSYFYNSQ